MNGQWQINVRPSSEDTANLGNWGIIGDFDPTSGTAEFDHPIHKFFPERVVFGTPTQGNMVCLRLTPERSANPSKFQTNTYYATSKQNYLLISFKGASRAWSYDQGHIKFVELSDPTANWFEGPPDNAWTVQTWVLDADECRLSYEDEIESFKGELNDLLSEFKSGTPLQRPPELLKMAEEVANQIGKKKEDDIDNWAEELSKNLSKLSD